jgi:hypothetical protein
VPTVAIVDRLGVVTYMWVGKLPPLEEQGLMSKLRLEDTRSSRDGAKNIPLDELPVRAQNELPLYYSIVIYSNNSSESDLAYSILESQDFARIFFLVQNAIPPANDSRY